MNAKNKLGSYIYNKRVQIVFIRNYSNLSKFRFYLKIYKIYSSSCWSKYNIINCIMRDVEVNNSFFSFYYYKTLVDIIYLLAMDIIFNLNIIVLL